MGWSFSLLINCGLTVNSWYFLKKKSCHRSLNKICSCLFFFKNIKKYQRVGCSLPIVLIDAFLPEVGFQSCQPVLCLLADIGLAPSLGSEFCVRHVVAVVALGVAFRAWLAFPLAFCIKYHKHNKGFWNFFVSCNFWSDFSFSVFTRRGWSKFWIAASSTFLLELRGISWPNTLETRRSCAK